MISALDPEEVSGFYEEQYRYHINSSTENWAKLILMPLHKQIVEALLPTGKMEESSNKSFLFSLLIGEAGRYYSSSKSSEGRILKKLYVRYANDFKATMSSIFTED